MSFISFATLSHIYCFSISFIKAGIFLSIMKETLCIVGLGYVGLPLAVAFSKHYSIIGFDINQKRILELQEKKENDQSLLISSSESDSTWVYATIYEYELEWVNIGQEAVITATAYPAKEFKGKIIAIDPVFNAS